MIWRKLPVFDHIKKSVHILFLSVYCKLGVFLYSEKLDDELNSNCCYQTYMLFNFTMMFFLFLVTDKAPSEATFKGTEFLSYDLGQTGGEPIVSAQDAISLYFRTRQPNGLLFYTGKTEQYNHIYIYICMFIYVSAMNKSSSHILHKFLCCSYI